MLSFEHWRSTKRTFTDSKNDKRFSKSISITLDNNYTFANFRGENLVTLMKFYLFIAFKMYYASNVAHNVNNI